MGSKPKKYNDKRLQKTSDMNKSTNNQGNVGKNFSLMTRLDSLDLPQGSQPELRDRDLRLGRATWNKYVLPVHDFPSVLFKELFNTYPEHEPMFLGMVKSKTNRDIFDSADFKTHMRARVMTKLKDIMESLDKPEELNDMMTKLGLYHAKLGVTRKHLTDMQRTIIMAVRLVMNKTMQSDEEEALDKCFKFAFEIAINTAEDYVAKQSLQDKKNVHK